MSDEKKQITMSQLGEHKSHDDLWLLVDGKVYDVSKFMDEHPGGDEVLLSEGGKDATEAFEDVGHSDDARALLPKMLVGEIEGGSSAPAKAKSAGQEQTVSQSSHPLFMFVPLIFLAAYYYYNNFK